jgi:hypothetical protein
LSNRSADAGKEKPGASGNATGLNQIDLAIKAQDYIKNRETATALCHAILDCDPADACEILAVAYGDLRAGMPIAPLEGLISEARVWAEFATTAELKAYALACYTRLSAGDQAAFLRHVGGRNDG